MKVRRRGGESLRRRSVYHCHWLVTPNHKSLSSDLPASKKTIFFMSCRRRLRSMAHYLGSPFFPGGPELWHHPLAYSTAGELPGTLQHATLVHPALHPQVPTKLWSRRRAPRCTLVIHDRYTRLLLHGNKEIHEGSRTENAFDHDYLEPSTPGFFRFLGGQIVGLRKTGRIDANASICASKPTTHGRAERAPMSLPHPTTLTSIHASLPHFLPSPALASPVGSPSSQPNIAVSNAQCSTLFVANLGQFVSEHELKDIFSSKCAPIAIRVPIHVGLISAPRGGDITMSWCVRNICYSR
ncbi:hypothetical protein DBV15_10686 [Temnothorax longispinosus]|uniref:RRM domain-containing protein n=1 Tax=Temnothorax longispinosus TaxID=300112 RepID=A0A4S2KRB3_9HYME|nr:hypothetical protein DBV15_10686 [Temnothorax longispinosus]